MFSDLTQKLDGILSKLKNKGKISEKDIAETAREVRRALLEADVNYRVARQFLSDVEAKSLGSRVMNSQAKPRGWACKLTLLVRYCHPARLFHILW